MAENNSQIPDFLKDYIDPTSGNIPGSSILKDIPIVGDLFGGLFGGDEEPKWKPYIDENGNYVWADPAKRVPVPVTDVPGARVTPGGAYRKMSEQIKAITDLLPFYSRAVAGQIIPTAQATLAAQQITSPQLAQLMVDLYGKYGTQLNTIGNEIARQNALAQVGTDTAALEKARTTLLPVALEAAKQYDPEYFATRALTSQRLADLLGNIDLSSGLSPTERREVEQSLAQEGTRRGTYNAPSALDTVSNAMQFGEKGFNRLQTNRSALSTAIANATAAMPAFKSGVDVFQVATGKPSVPNTGEGRFTGVNDVSNSLANSAGLATNMAGNIQQSQMLSSQLNAQKKDWADYLNQVTSSIGNITGSVGGIAGMAGLCWIAQKVYGQNNPKWLQFRNWLLTKAPDKLRNLYMKYGERIAAVLNNENTYKVRNWMNTILAQEI